MFLLEYPEIRDLYKVLLQRLLDESGRGALLIATAHVDDFLTELLKEVFPKDLSKSQRDRLLKYPGHLSSFSAKIELAYSFRIIGENLYNSLNALRRIRNDAAHDSSDMKLHDLNEKMKEVYNLGEAVPYVIKTLSAEVMIEMKLMGIKDGIDELNLTPEEKREKVIELFSDQTIIDSLEKQLPFWELIHGICLVCGMIVYHKKKMIELTKDMYTWDNLLKPKEISSFKEVV